MSVLPTAVTLPAQTVVGNPMLDDEPAQSIPFATLTALLVAALSDTSTTSLTIGTGSITLTGSANKAWQPGMFVTVSEVGTPSYFMGGVITGYNPSTGVYTIDVLTTGGAGTVANWNITLSGPQGATGPQGSGSYPAAVHNYTGSTNAPTTDDSSLINLSGGLFTLSLGGSTTYTTGYTAIVTNEDTTAAKFVAASGLTEFTLWPGQSVDMAATPNGWQPNPSSQRWHNANVVLYVNPTTGSDTTNDGLTSTRPFATIQNAITVIHKSIDCMGAPPLIQLADGTHSVGTGVTIDYPLVGSAQLYITGNNAQPDNCIISCLGGNNCFNARDLSTATLSGMLLTTTGNGSVALSVSQGATLDVGGTGPVNFGAFPLGDHIAVSEWAALNVLTNYTIEGDAATHITATDGGHINYGTFAVTGLTGLAFTTFAEAVTCGVITAGGVPMTFVGFTSCTGTRYTAQVNGVIESSGTVFPGNSAGTTSSGGYYA